MGDVVLECVGLTRYFGALAAVDDLSFRVEHGSIFGIAGPNGAGKTTLFNLLSGHVSLSRGVIRFDGREIQRQPPDRICHLGIARTFQIPHVFGGMTVAENVLVGGYFGRRSRLPGMHFTADAWQRVDATLEVTGLTAKRDWPAYLLPVFEKKLLMVASALATEPRILMLDEPVGGLNHGEIAQFMDLIRRINASGITVLVIEHVMRALMGLSHRVMIMHGGQKLAEGTPAEVSRDPAVVQVYLGREAGAA